MNKQTLSCVVIATCAVLLMTADKSHAQDNSPQKWGAHLDVEGKAGTDRSLGEADLFVPILQNDDTLLFTSLRTRFDDSNGREGNFGLGVRHMHESGWNLGGIAYFDRRQSEWGNHFNQVTVGAEALSTDWDFRTNAYIPQGRRVRNVDALSEASLSGTTISFRGGEERSMTGYDVEIGWRLPVYEPEEPRQIRLFAGGYHFFADKVANVTGPRLRSEMTFDEVPWLWNGSRFSIGSEWQHDKPRGSQGFVTARLRIPLQFFGAGRKRLSPMERRMTDPVVRDIDVVTQAGAFGATETATGTADGQALTVITASSVADTDELNNALTTAGASTVIIGGAIDVDKQVNMAAGQTLVGSGNITVKSPSGRKAVLTVSGGKIAATNQNNAYTLLMRDNSKLIGMTVSNSNNGIGTFAVRADNTTGVTIENSTLTSFDGTTSSVAIAASSSTNLVVRNNTLSASSNTATTNGIVVGNATNATIANNRFSISTTGTNRVITGNGGTSFNDASTGNTTNDGSCFFSAAPTGSVGFSTINCP